MRERAETTQALTPIPLKPSTPNLHTQSATSSLLPTWKPRSSSLSASSSTSQRSALLLKLVVCSRWSCGDNKSYIDPEIYMDPY